MDKDIFESIRNETEKRNLRERTIQLYCSDVSYFLRWIKNPISELTLEDAESFLTAKRLEGRSPETHNHYRSAIKFFYKKVLKILWDDDTVPAMKRERNLPAVLTRNEINAIIDATTNLKHKAIIATMYSSGLRVSEVVHLHYDDISRTNMTIHVRETKGRIDRYTILSQKNLDLLTEYWFQYGRPKDILFPSSWTGGYLDIASVNQFFKKSAKLAGITRRVSSHACRHSFASHLFESGTDTKEWIPYCKKPFDGAESVIRYLGKYTHRIAISNYRIKGMTESTVTFSVKDYKKQGQWKESTLSGEEFIRRFLMHVPPKRFVRIRHYGLLSSRNKNTKITICRNILGCQKYISRLKDIDTPAMHHPKEKVSVTSSNGCRQRASRNRSTDPTTEKDSFNIENNTAGQYLCPVGLHTF